MGLFSNIIYGSRQRSQSTSENVKSSATTLIRYLRLLVEDMRLTAAEKLTVLFATVAFYSLLLIVGMVALVFISIGIGHWLAATVAPMLAYLYIAAFYLILLILLVAFKRQLLIDPICRFITRLLVEPPKPEHKTKKTRPDETVN